MQARAWQHNGELTHTVPWFSTNETALRATIADLMESPGVRSVSYQDQKHQLLVRFDRSVTNEAKLRAAALNRTLLASDVIANDVVRWGPTASMALLKLAVALAR
jgi:hypothetical protein